MNEFENLKYKQIKTLLEVVNHTKEKNLEVIRKQHKSVSENFTGAMRFLQELKILKEKNGIVSVKKAFQVTLNGRLSDGKLKGLLLNELLTTKSVLFQAIQTYLDKFKIVQNTFEYNPNTASRIKESGVRNLLMELDLIVYINSVRTYKINKRHFDSFEIYLNHKKLSPEELTLILKRKNDLGRAAELEVLRYEKKRLAKYPGLAAKIEHIAKKNVLAGFDILSWEAESDNNHEVPRYIEVKAISREDYNFYWSHNEIEKAQKMTTRYYLYLLPVIDNKQFDVGALEIISDPITKVFNNSKRWNQQIETYLFSQKQKR